VATFMIWTYANPLSVCSISTLCHVHGSRVIHNRHQEVSYRFHEDQSTDQRLEGLRWLQISESEMQRRGRGCSLQSVRSLIFDVHIRFALLYARTKATVRFPTWAYVLHRLIRVPGNMHPPHRYWRRRPQIITQGLGHQLLAQWI
jgi:hypothetical protein